MGAGDGAELQGQRGPPARYHPGQQVRHQQRQVGGVARGDAGAAPQQRHPLSHVRRHRREPRTSLLTPHR